PTPPRPRRQRHELHALPRQARRLSVPAPRSGPSRRAEPFAARLHARMSRLGTRVCLGLDPRPAAHPLTDPERLGAASPWDPAVARAVVRYLAAVLEAGADPGAACPPQAAVFEAMGPAGDAA